MDLITERDAKRLEVHEAFKILEKCAVDRAAKTSRYRVDLAAEMVRLGNTDEAKTVIEKLAKGNKQVAKAKYDEVLSNEMYFIGLKKVDFLMMELKILEAQINREWVR